MRVILLSFSGRPDIVRAVEELRPRIEQRVQVVASDFTGRMDLTPIEADLAIVFGGDGSILRAAHQMGYRQLPVIAVNLGKLGFLADISPDELLGLLENFSLDGFHVVEYLMFECRVFREAQVLCHQLGLNEVAIQAGPPFAILDVDLYVDAELVTTYSGDGLIVSTPIGSTAHSLSAGGPILRQDLQAFVISPISPHTLTNRPVVDSANRVYEMVVPRPNPGTAVVVDGRVLATLRAGDRVRVERAEARFRMVAVPEHSYYRTLREKLGWGGRLQYPKGNGEW
jgi:NAD+ kinase